MGLFSKLFKRQSENPNNDTSHLPEIDWEQYKTAKPEAAEPAQETLIHASEHEAYTGDDARELFELAGIKSSWKLSYAGTKDIQDNIRSCSINDTVAIKYDSTAEKYAVFDNKLLIGYLSKNSSNRFGNSFECEEYIAFIDCFETDSKENSIPRISAFVLGSLYDAPSSEPFRHHEVKPVGITFPCKKKMLKNRQSVLKHLKVGDVVDVEEYVYDGKAAYMFVDRKTGADFGVIPKAEAEYIKNEWDIKRFEAYVCYTDTFGVYDEDLDSKVTRYTCTVYVNFYK